MVKISPPGPRTRRSGGAISLAGGDVPIVSPASDPGVNVPRQDAGVGGLALQVAGGALAAGTDLELRVLKREEGLARAANRTSFADFNQDLVRDLQKAGNLADSQEVEAAGDALIQEQQRILDEHRGGSTSRALLENELIKIRNSTSDTLAVLNINAADVQLNQEVKTSVSGIVNDVHKDPDVVNDDVDPLEPFRFHVSKVEDMMDFFDLSPAQRRVQGPNARAEVALSMITPLIKNGQFARARALLRNDEVAAVLEGGQQRDALVRIRDAERAQKADRSEAQELREMATFLLPVGASEDEIRLQARELFKMGQDNNSEVFKNENGDVFLINKTTGGYKKVMSGPSIEEQIARKTEYERGLMVGNLKTLKLIADETGIPLFKPKTGTSADGKEGDTSKTTGTTTTGEEGETISPEGLPQISEEAITQTFGPEPENAPDPDTQAYMGHLAMGRVLMLAGKIQDGRGHLALAAGILAGSESMRFRKDMTTVIKSPEMLAVLGGSPGDTLADYRDTVIPTVSERQVAKQNLEPITEKQASQNQVPITYNHGQMMAALEERARLGGEGSSGIPDTPEEKARKTAIAAKRGVAQVEAEEQLSFVREAQVNLKNVLEELEIDPTLVGAVGSFRAKGRSFVTLLNDLGMDDLLSAFRDSGDEDLAGRADVLEGFVSTATLESSEALTDPETGETGFELTLSLFENPTLSSLDIIEHSIGVIIARISTPAGRIPVELIRRSIELVGLKGLRGSKVIIDRLNFVNDRMLQPRVDSIMKRFPELRPEETEEIEEQGISDEGIQDGEQDTLSGQPDLRFEGGKLFKDGELYIPPDPNAAPGDGSDLGLTEELESSTIETEEEGGPLEELLGPLFPSGLLSGKFKGLDAVNSAIIKGVDTVIEELSSDLKDLSQSQFEAVRKEIDDWLPKDIDSSALKKRIKGVTKKGLTEESLNGIIQVSEVARELLNSKE